MGLSAWCERRLRLRALLCFWTGSMWANSSEAGECCKRSRASDGTCPGATYQTPSGGRNRPPAGKKRYVRGGPQFFQGCPCWDSAPTAGIFMIFPTRSSNMSSLLNRRQFVFRGSVAAAAAAFASGSLARLGLAASSDEDVIPFLDPQPIKPNSAAVKWQDLTEWITPAKDFFDVSHYA